MVRFFPLLSLLFATACSGYGTRVRSLPEGAGYRLVMRPAPLPRGRVVADCGPEALAAILRFHGKPADVDGITRRIYDARLKGTLSIALAPAARELGLAAQLMRGSVWRIREAVDRNEPCIIMVEVRKGLNHFFVVVGYNEARQEIVCEDYDGGKILLQFEELEKGWEAVGYYMLELSESHVAAEVDLAQDLEGRGEFEKAMEHYRRALADEPENVDALVGLGNCLYALKDLVGAREQYEKALKQAPEEPLVCNNLADLYVAIGTSLEEAERLAGVAVSGYEKLKQELEQELPRARLEHRARIKEEMEDARLRLAGALGTLGQVRAANGRHELAIGAWKSALDTLPLDEFDLRARRFYEIGQSYEKLSMPSEARKHYARGLEIVRDPELKVKLEGAMK